MDQPPPPPPPPPPHVPPPSSTEDEPFDSAKDYTYTPSESPFVSPTQSLESTARSRNRMLSPPAVHQNLKRKDGASSSAVPPPLKRAATTAESVAGAPFGVIKESDSETEVDPLVPSAATGTTRETTESDSFVELFRGRDSEGTTEDTEATPEDSEATGED